MLQTENVHITHIKNHQPEMDLSVWWKQTLKMKKYYNPHLKNFINFWDKIYLCLNKKNQYIISMCVVLHNLITCVDSSNHYNGQDTELFRHHKGTLLCYPFIHNLRPVPIPWQPLIYSPSLQFCHFKNVIYINGIIQYVTIWDWLFFHSA